MRKTGESRALAWADWLGGRCIRPTFQNTRQAADVINSWYDAVRHIRSKRPRALSARRTIRKPSEADPVLRCCRISHLPHERASFDAAEPDAIARGVSGRGGAAHQASAARTIGLCVARASSAAA